MAGKSLLDVFCLTRVLMMTMRDVSWQNWSNNVAVNLPQRWRGWSVAFANPSRNVVLNVLFMYFWVATGDLTKERKIGCFVCRLQIWHWLRKIKPALRIIWTVIHRRILVLIWQLLCWPLASGQATSLLTSTFLQRWYTDSTEKIWIFFPNKIYICWVKYLMMLLTSHVSPLL